MLQIEPDELLTLQFDRDALALIMRGLGELPAKDSGMLIANIQGAIYQITQQRDAQRLARAEAVDTAIDAAAAAKPIVNRKKRRAAQAKKK